MGETTMPAFDYEAFGKELYDQVCKMLKKHGDKKDEIYAFSISYWPEFTTSISARMNTKGNLASVTGDDGTRTDSEYMYYKCCEEEWDIWDDFEGDALSKELQTYYDKFYAWIDEDLDNRDDARFEHTRKIVDQCVSVLKKVKAQAPEYAMYPALRLNVFVSEYFSEEEQVEIYEQLNDGAAVADFRTYLYGEE